MKQREKRTILGLHRLAIWLTVVTGVCMLLQTGVMAIARGYETDDIGLQTGMAVALSTGDNTEDKVERASNQNSDRIVGIVTTFEDSLVTVTSGNAKVLVESEGEVDAYISDSGGEVKKGDLLTLSNYRGILAKGNANQDRILAIAGSDFVAASPETYTVKDGNNTKQIKIAKIKVNLNRQGSSNPAVVTNSSLAKLGKAIVGKDIGEIRVLIAMIIFFIVLIAEGGILYGAISSSITALGRNPLAKKIIRKELVRVVIIAVIVLGVGLGAIYGVLWA